MPGKTPPDLFNTALAQLEEIVAELEFNGDVDLTTASSNNLNEDLNQPTESKLDMANLESNAGLTGFKNPSGLNVTVPPKK